MKKILLSAVAIMALGTAAQAQDMQFGVKAGLNMANLGGDAETEGTRMGLHIGGVAEFKLSETFSIQPELLYSMQGAKVMSWNGDLMNPVIEEEDLKLDYLTIPIMAKYYVMEGLSLEVGPQVGFLMSAKQGDTDIKDGMETIDFSINAGVGYALESGLFFQARYNAGLSNIYKDSEELDDADVSVTNTVIGLSVGYKF